VRVIHHVHGRAVPAATATTTGARARQVLKRVVPTPLHPWLRRWRKDDEGFSPDQRERLLRHHAHWRRKWGWDPLNPDVPQISRRWGETEVCWRLSPQRRAAGQEIIRAFEARTA